MEQKIYTALDALKHRLHEMEGSIMEIAHDLQKTRDIIQGLEEETTNFFYEEECEECEDSEEEEEE